MPLRKSLLITHFSTNTAIEVQFGVTVILSRLLSLSIVCIYSITVVYTGIIAVFSDFALLDDNITGTLVPSDDDQAMAQALWHAYSNPDAYLAMGITARQQALENFALGGMIRQYEALF
jgi:glycosyltransferase involved in cell wall biosynthesis